MSCADVTAHDQIQLDVLIHMSLFSIVSQVQDVWLSIYSSQDISFHMMPSYRFAGCQIPHTQMIPISMKQSPHSARTDERQFNIFQQS